MEQGKLGAIIIVTLAFRSLRVARVGLEDSSELLA